MNEKLKTSGILSELINSVYLILIPVRKVSVNL